MYHRSRWYFYIMIAEVDGMALIVIGAIIVVTIAWEFCLICPDKVPFRRKRRK